MIDNEEEDENDVSGAENPTTIPRPLAPPLRGREGGGRRGGPIEEWGRARGGGPMEGGLMSRSVISVH